MKLRLLLFVGLSLPLFLRAQTYCTPTLNPSFAPQITKVSFGTINNVTTAGSGSSCPTYNYYSAQTAAMQPGQTATLTIDVQQGCSSANTNSYLRAYIDYNNDGDFLDANENIFSSGQFQISTRTFTQSVTIPAGVAAAVTRMRVILIRLNDDGSCGAIGDNGEAEDYNIDFTCPAKNGITLSRSGNECTATAETFTASGAAGGVTLTWETSTDGVTWTSVGTGASISLGPFSQATIIRLKADNGSCSGYISTRFSKLAWTATASPTSVCPGATTQLDAPNLPTSYSYLNNKSYSVPDNTPAGGISPLDVLGVLPTNIGTGTLNRVCFSMTHAINSDVTVYLIGPDGTQLTLANKKGGSNYTNTCFAPGAATALPGGNNKTGTYRPDGGDLLTAFSGKPTNGTWQLKAVDNVSQDAGTITKFEMHFNAGTVSWSPTAGLSNPNIKNPIATVSENTTYTVTYTPAGGGSCNPTANVSVTVEPTYTPTVTGSNTVCEGNSTTLTADVAGFSSTYRWYDAASGGTLLNTTATYNVSPTATTTYWVEATYEGCTGPRTSFTVTFIPTPATPTGTDVETCFNKPAEVSGTSTTSGVTYDWYDASTGGTRYIANQQNYTTAPLTANTSFWVEALKNGCPSIRKEIKVNVNPLPAQPAVSDEAICSGSKATFTATAPAGATYNWFLTSVTTSISGTGTTYTTEDLTNSSTVNDQQQSYWVTATDAKGCESVPRKEVKVTIKANPAAPSITSPHNICENTSTNLTATQAIGTDQANWWDAASAGTNLTTTATYTTPVLTNDVSYWVSSVRNGCTSARTKVDVVMVRRPVVSTIADKVICSGNNVAQSITVANATGSTVSWTSVMDPQLSFAAGSTGTKSNQNAAIASIDDVINNTNGPVGDITYTITSTTTATANKPACPGNTVSFKVSVRPLPAIPAVNDEAICIGSSVTFTATAPGGTYTWYNTAATNSPLGTGTTFTPSSNPSSTRQYFVDANDGTCFSPSRKVVTVTVYPYPVAPTVASINVCQDSVARFTVSSAADTYNWYDAASGGNLLASQADNLYTSPTISSSSTIYVSATTNGCEGPRSAATATMITTPTLDAIGNPTICPNAALGTELLGNHPSGVHYQWTSTLSSGIAGGNTNPASSTASSTINDVLTNTSGAPAQISYTVRSYSNTSPACPSLPRNFVVTVNPEFEVTANITDVICYGKSTGSIVADGSAGKQPASYQWKQGTALLGTDPNLDNIPSGTYQLVVTDADGCSVPKSYTVAQPANDIIISGNLTHIDCFGNNTGAISTTVSNTVGTVLYSWSSGESSANIANKPFGSYTVTVTDANNCSKQNTITLTQPSAPLSVSENINHVLCYGAATGGITAVISGGTPFTTGAPYTTAWSNGASTQNISSVKSGSYTLNITDKNGCTLMGGPYLIQQPTDTLELDKVVTNINCFGASTGAIDITPMGGTSPYTYAWNVGSTNQDLSGLPLGTYSITITDNNNCKYSEAIDVTQNPLIQGNGVISDFSGFGVSCDGKNDGFIDLSTSGGQAPYSFAWSNSTNTEDVNTLTAGTYQVEITDNLGCMVTETYNLTQPNSLTGTLALSTYIGGVNVSCFGGSNGEISFTPSGGAAPYTTALNGLSQTYPASGLSAGNYTVAVTDANSCIYSIPVTLTEPSNLAPNAVKSTYAGGFNIQCAGLNNGSITLSPVGGTSPYDYIWSSGETSSSIQDKTVGTYSVRVTDANNCEYNYSYGLTEPPVFNTSLTPSTYVGGVNISCNGNHDGSITNNPVGGTSPFTYAWSNGELTRNLNNIAAGTYSVSITDANGCLVNDQITLVEPQALTGSHNSTSYNGYEIRCNGESNGNVTFIISGGTGPYSYQWNTGTMGNVLNNMPAGNYTVVTTDANNCKLPYVVSLNEPLPLGSVEVLSNFNGFGVSCFDQTNGSAQITATGGAANGPSDYTITWSSGLNPNVNQSNLAPGFYNYTLSDLNGCQYNDNINITRPAPLSGNITQSAQILCYGQATGALNSTINGGVKPYNYAWFNSVNTPVGNGPIASSLVAEIYRLEVTDANGCTFAITNQVITEPPLLTTSVSGINPSCFGFTNGSASASASGGTPGYSYQWIGGPMSNSWTNIGAGLKTMRVTDNNGCIASASITLNQPQQLMLNTLTAQLISCDNKASGAVQVAGQGGTPPYSFLWSNGNNSGTVTNLIPGSYDVDLTDSKNCLVSNNYQVVNVVTPDPYFTTSDPLCGDLVATINASDAVGFNKFTFITGGGNLTTSDNLSYNLVSSAYGYTVIKREMNLQGCKSSHIDTIAFKDIPSASFVYDINKEIDVLNNEVKFSNTSAVSNLTQVQYNWLVNQIPTQNGVAPKISLPNNEEQIVDVCLEVVNGFGCQDTYCEPVIVKGKTLLYVPNTFTPDFDGINDTWSVSVQGIKEGSFVVRIFNRFGEEVYTSKDPDFKWNGTYNSILLPQGSYPYEISYITKDGEQKGRKSGIVTLLP